MRVEVVLSWYCSRVVQFITKYLTTKNRFFSLNPALLNKRIGSLGATVTWGWKRMNNGYSILFSFIQNV
jgi:hypothetical protein